MMHTWQIEINHDTERTYFIATISDPRLIRLKFPGVTDMKRSFMMKQFESEYIAHWSPAPAIREPAAQPTVEPAPKRLCSSLGSFTTFMSKVAATCDEPAPAEAVAPEVPLKSEVETGDILGVAGR